MLGFATGRSGFATKRTQYLSQKNYHFEIVLLEAAYEGIESTAHMEGEHRLGVSQMYDSLSVPLGSSLRWHVLL